MPSRQTWKASTPTLLPTRWRPLPDDCAEAYWRVSRAIRDTGMAILERSLPPGRQGTATADTIVVSATIPDSRNRLATLLHEYAHVLAHFGPVARDKDERQCELETESACYVVLAHLGIDYPFSRDYLLHYRVTPDLLYQSLAAVQGIVRRMMRAVEGATGGGDKQLDRKGRATPATAHAAPVFLAGWAIRDQWKGS